jgi:glycine/D-amino acid oxidase-like deaminating enzyme
VGLSTACSILEKHPEQQVVILEKGVIPTGASTKNAGFICTNSIVFYFASFQATQNSSETLPEWMRAKLLISTTKDGKVY